MPRSRIALLLAALALPALAACDTGDPTPDQIRRVVITEIRITDAPLRQPDGDHWDSLNGAPDIYVELINETGNTVVESYRDEHFPNVDGNDFPLVYALGTDLPELTFNAFDLDLVFDLFDEDPSLTKGDDDYMGSTNVLNLLDVINSGAPSSASVTSPDGSIAVRVNLRYER